MSDNYWSIVRVSSPKAEKYNIFLGTSTVGRDIDCTIIIHSGIISRHHSSIKVFQSGHIYVRDISSNGTFVNGKRIIFDRYRRLKINDIIAFGRPRLREKDVGIFSDFIYKVIRNGPLPPNIQPCEICDHQTSDVSEEDDVIIDETSIYLKDGKFTHFPIYEGWEAMVIKKEMTDDLALPVVVEATSDIEDDATSDTEDDPDWLPGISSKRSSKEDDRRAAIPAQNLEEYESNVCNNTAEQEHSEDELTDEEAEPPTQVNVVSSNDKKKSVSDKKSSPIPKLILSKVTSPKEVLPPKTTSHKKSHHKSRDKLASKDSTSRESRKKHTTRSSSKHNTSESPKRSRRKENVPSAEEKVKESSKKSAPSKHLSDKPKSILKTNDNISKKSKEVLWKIASQTENEELGDKNLKTDKGKDEPPKDSKTNGVTYAIDKKSLRKYTKTALTKYTPAHPLKSRLRGKKEKPAPKIMPSIDVTNERKKKLQEIAARETAKSGAKVTRRNSIAQPVAMKVSEGRGCFLTEPIVTQPKNVLENRKFPETAKTSLAPASENQKNKYTPVGKVPSHENEFIQHILRWSVAAFKKDIRPTEMSDILFNKKFPDPMVRSYTDENHYIRTVRDLLLIEIWSALSLRHNASDVFVETSMELSVVRKPIRLNQYIYAIRAETITSFKNWQDEINVGHIVEVFLPIGPMSVLGYIEKLMCISDPTPGKPPKYTMDLLFYDKNLNGNIDKISYNTKMPYTVLHSITSEVMSMRAVKCIQGSPISNLVIRPTKEQFKPHYNQYPLKWKQPVSAAQKSAINQCLAGIATDQASIQLIRGPPGTGKSHFICSFAMEFFCDPKRLANKWKKILICAHSNTIVDDIVLRLLNMKCYLPKSNEKISIVRVGHEHVMKEWCQSVSLKRLATQNIGSTALVNQAPTDNSNMVLINEMLVYHTKAMVKMGPQHLYFKQQREYFEKKLRVMQLVGNSSRSMQAMIEEEEQKILKEANIIITTLSSIGLYKLEIITGQFATCIIDEAGKATEAETLAPLLLNIPHIILVGDETQIASHICSKAKDKGFTISLFTRLHETLKMWRGNPICKLNEQYRIHPEIFYWPNKTFYQNQVKSDEKNFRDIGWLPPYRVVFIRDEEISKGRCESILVSTFARAIKNSVLKALPSLTMAILTAFSDQKSRIQMRTADTGIEVEVIDQLQGQERDIVIVSLASSTGVLCGDPGRITSILTRAKCCLIVCCNRESICHSLFWKEFIEDAEQRMMTRTIPAYCNVNFLKDSGFQNTCLDFLK